MNPSAKTPASDLTCEEICKLVKKPSKKRPFNAGVFLFKS